VTFLCLFLCDLHNLNRPNTYWHTYENFWKIIYLLEALSSNDVLVIGVKQIVNMLILRLKNFRKLCIPLLNSMKSRSRSQQQQQQQQQQQVYAGSTRAPTSSELTRVLTEELKKM